VPVPPGIARRFTQLSWRLHLQPTPPGWLDMALSVPILDTTRATEELGWRPQWSASEALLDLLQGLREGAGADTPPLSPETGGPARVEEIATGVGAREKL
jgi:UDP-glucose 4-epimerase